MQEGLETRSGTQSVQFVDRPCDEDNGIGTILIAFLEPNQRLFIFN